jgi:DNA-binding response OmpR family regulator
MDDMRRAVVVEDDRDIGDLISGLLDKAGFEVAVARTGTDALALVRETAPDLVTLDLTLPDIDGVEVCRQIRQVSDCYVIVVSARIEEVDRLIGLEVGADDYLDKPFSLRELQARVAALFRRPRQRDAASVVGAVPPSNGNGRPGQLGCEHLTLDRDARGVTVGGHPIELTRTEFDLLVHLVSRSGLVIGRDELLREVWATEYVPDSTHVVDVHLANLRRKLRAAAPENDWIRTIRGVGFRFDPCCA